ncbi:cytochrome P450 2J2 isoform X2 [Amia ocellicauda]|uniref:cytochrome P450 2J2 isoform X2 n=1 Tax=Amia ocellicauda TaxID=2972642 RepID=UPI00346494E6
MMMMMIIFHRLIFEQGLWTMAGTLCPNTLWSTICRSDPSVCASGTAGYVLSHSPQQRLTWRFCPGTRALWDWLDARSVLLFLFIFIILLDLFRNKAPKNFPPGPRGLPLVGNMLAFDMNSPHLYVKKLADQYGDIFSLRVGQRAVFLNGYKLVKEALVHDGDSFADRPEIPLFVDIFKNKGLVGSNGYHWKQQRRFALTTLRNFGLGKKNLESSILLECRCLAEAIESEQGRPFDPQFTINNAVSNIICSVVFGDRFEYSDSRFQDLLRLIDEAIFLDGSFWAHMYNMFPWVMRRIPGPHSNIFSHWEAVMSFVKSQIKQHKQDWDPSAPRDYIDCYLTEMKKCQENVDGGFDEETLVFCTLDLFAAGTETTSTTLRWGLLYMIKYPEIQKKVQAEIDRVVGQGRPPSMADRAKMPYTDAVIHEVQRFGNIVPLNIPRRTTRDITLRGYFIPKGTLVTPNLTSVLFDKNEWETPDTFNPGHFLDADGKFMRRDAFMPFSAGKRVCLGESLARMELFLFFTSFLQRFTFTAPPGEEPSLEFRMGTTLCPKPFRLCAVPR